MVINMFETLSDNQIEVLKRYDIDYKKYISLNSLIFEIEEILNEEVEEILIPLSKEITNYNRIHKVPVKWFEAITSLSLIYFAKDNCDIAILETGLGGKLKIK